MRLDKYLADMSVGTRSEVKGLIKSGKVVVNGQIEKDSGRKLDIKKDEVCCQGVRVGYQKFEYYMLNKPAGVITATEDKRDKTVLDLLSEVGKKDLFPVGRLDKDTVGLLLITNDGQMAHKMLSPKKHVAKKYFVRVDGYLTDEMCRELSQGVFIEKDTKSQPAQVDIVSNKDNEAEVFLTICEGKFHQVKKMFAAVKRTVIYLKRVEFGPIVLDESLSEGEYRPLTESELLQIEDWRTDE